MHKHAPASYAPLLGLAARLRAGESLTQELAGMPFFRQFEADKDAAATELARSQSFAQQLLADLPEGLPAEYFLNLATESLLAGCTAITAAMGVRTHNKEVIRREIGRIVVKNAFPRALSCYAAGSYGDFTTHRLPLTGFVAGLHIASEEITAQQAISKGLLAARKSFAVTTRQRIQAEPNTAIRSPKTGKPLAKWNAEHWLQITWRLGYTTLLDVLTQTREAKHEAGPAPAELVAALRTITQAYQEVFAAYLAPPAYAVVGEAYTLQVAA